MSSRRTLYAAALAGAVLVSGAVGFAIAQPAPPAPPPATQGAGPAGPMERHGMHGMHGRQAEFRPGRHIEGRIAFLKTELKITDAQLPAFNAFAEALRTEAKSMGEKHDRMRARGDKPVDAIERLELRTQAMKQAAEASQRMLDVAKPLYAQFSPEQKATADELLAKRGPHRMMMRH